VYYYHNIRTRKSGPQRFIDFHILVAGDMTVQTAHDLCEVIEKEIEDKLASTQVTIHVEPVEDKSSWDAVKGIEHMV
ncbi:MAG: cation transporter dimerization domain-containing protein, partial [bacterium]